VAQPGCIVERWMRWRRLEHTRALLLDAGEEVLPKKASRQ
jgi:hypothetical protein